MRYPRSHSICPFETLAGNHNLMPDLKQLRILCLDLFLKFAKIPLPALDFDFYGSYSDDSGGFLCLPAIEPFLLYC